MRMKRLFVLALIVVASMVLAACVAGPTPTPAHRTLRMMTHDSFDISEEVIAAFEEEHNATVEVLQSGDAGVMLNQAILSKDDPIADVLYGVDNTLLSRALNEGVFEAYESPMLEQIPDQFELDDEYRALPVDYGDVCPNYDKAWFEENDVEPPTDIEDLTAPEYEGLTVVEDASTSSPGLAFLLATIGHFGESGDYTYLDYWGDLVDNDVLVAQDWNAAYYDHFTVYGGGDRPIVISYASSPPVEVLFSEEALEEAPTAAVVENESCFRQVEFVGILQGTENRDLAEAWVDYMLGVAFQEDIPLHMFVFPTNENAELPEVFAEFAVIPDDPAQVDFEAIEENREQWIDAWAEVALQ